MEKNNFTIFLLIFFFNFFLFFDCGLLKIFYFSFIFFGFLVNYVRKIWFMKRKCSFFFCVIRKERKYISYLLIASFEFLFFLFWFIFFYGLYYRICIRTILTWFIGRIHADWVVGIFFLFRFSKNSNQFNQRAPTEIKREIYGQFSSFHLKIVSIDEMGIMYVLFFMSTTWVFSFGFEWDLVNDE